MIKKKKEKNANYAPLAVVVGVVAANIVGYIALVNVQRIEIG